MNRFVELNKIYTAKCAVIDELKDKNADIDTIKMCVRVAIAAAGLDLTSDEATELCKACADEIPFDPLAD